MFVFEFFFVFVMYLSFRVTPVSEIFRRVTVARDSLRLVGSCFDPLRREDKAPQFDPLRREHGVPATLLHRSTLSTFGTGVKRGRGRGLRKNEGDLHIRRGTRRTKRTRRTRREEWSS